MACFSVLGIGLSFVFGCILLGLVAEFYYVLWWKKKRNTSSSSSSGIKIEDQFYTKHINQISSHMFCWKKPSPKTQEITNSVVTNPDGPEPDLELGPPKDELYKGFGEEGVEAELIRLHNLCGPPRFLFTINEETKEDLESNDGRSRKGSRSRSLTDFLVSMETPVLTPLGSPSVKGNYPLESYNGFNPLFESFSEAELNKWKSSPPPKFKFLRDAEEKLLRKLVEEAEKKALLNHHLSSNLGKEERDGSLIRVIVGKSKEREANASQVLPLPSSPSRFRPVDLKNPVEQ